MFQKGDYVIYGNNGVCLIEDIGTLTDIHGASDDRLYYHLTPVHNQGVIYIPVDTKVFMRPVISRAQALDLIARIPSIPMDSYHSRDQRLMAEHYKQKIHTHECESLVQLIKTIRHRNQTLAKQRKRPCQTDLQYMKKAEDLFSSELSVALDLPVEQLPAFISEALQGKQAVS